MRREGVSSFSGVLRGAIFDIDGVILDSMGIWEDLGDRYLKGIGIEPQEGLGEILYPLSLPEGAAYLKSHYSLPETEQEILQGILAQMKSFYYEEAGAKPGVPEYLKRLAEAGIPAAAATSGDRDLAEHALERLGLRKYFSYIYTCAEVGVGKTEPAVYLAAADAMGLAPGECCVYEDAMYALRTAKDAGFQTAGVFDRYSRENQELLRQTADWYIIPGQTPWEAEQAG